MIFWIGDTIKQLSKG